MKFYPLDYPKSEYTHEQAVEHFLKALKRTLKEEEVTKSSLPNAEEFSEYESKGQIIERKDDNFWSLGYVVEDGVV